MYKCSECQRHEQGRLTWPGESGSVSEEGRLRRAKQILGLTLPPLGLVDYGDFPNSVHYSEDSDYRDLESGVDHVAHHHGCASAIQGRCYNLPQFVGDLEDFHKRKTDCLCRLKWEREYLTATSGGLLDHTRLWVHEYAPESPIWTAEPYSFDAAQLATLQHFLPEGLKIWVTGISPYTRTSMTVVVYSPEHHGESWDGGPATVDGNVSYWVRT